MADEAPSSSSKSDASNEELDLQRFLTWLVSNGVKGIGQEGSKVALFQTENGERGLLCEEVISPGEVVFEVPLRLALTDHPGDEESNQLVYKVKGKRVREVVPVCVLRDPPGASALHVLPRHVPAPLECYSWEDLTSLRYPPALEALHAADWLRADAFQSTSDEARGGLGEGEFRWALSVVHSRTFANAAPGGGVGVRMLVPLVDMLNHGGDTAAQGSLGLVGPGGGEVATDNVRWDLLPPDRSSAGGWSMAVSATRDIHPGQELLLSYGERPNDDFFLHYGFVPRANPHDDAVLWPDLEAALEWHYERLGALQLAPEAAERLYLAALEAGQQQLSEELQQLQPQKQQHGVEGEVLPPEVARQLAQIKVVAGGHVSAAVMRAFTAVRGGDVAAAERAVALRAAELLWSMSAGPSSASLPSSAAAAAMTGPSTAAVADAGGLLVELAALLADADPRVAAAAVASSPSTAEAEVDVEPESDEGRYWAAELRGYWQTLLPRAGSLPLLVATAVAAAVTVSSRGAVPPLGKLLRVLLPHAVAEVEAKIGVVAAGRDAFVTSAFRLSGPQRLSATFRSYKQMVLWDVVLGSVVASFLPTGTLTA
ncbi:hypothetical protein VOLCADRAFT_94881 [Volvox carteri f. nagariensis]|uniref:SET domain-containing protein n=1 Tax=Volvox carteri f. nagariensis TaxID=3068 RepID=D8U610_VOLCA|nr:uncharacterized protein VOLCADRAFT_94881 [Volvox carteri f. nagariensis]EFJ44774.1 hypothetical protein VOLCADRAFT_94881 [Volvox carteri f. nagariensis]|eukprot:XP_002954057.1 hypothetical protein VOLCADRAFT_94881 [Volvox carteri f. nagariensis]